jgi:hypothetical protein
MRTALQLRPRVEKLEAEATRARTPSVGAAIVDILEGRDRRPGLSDEELARTKVGRLLLQRRQRAEVNYPG